MARRMQAKDANLSEKNKKTKTRAVNNAAPQSRNTNPNRMQTKARVKKKKKRNARKILKWTCLIGIVIAAVIFLFTTPLFNVTEIKVLGNETLSSEEIESLSQIKMNENIFRNVKSSIVENIKGNAYIEDVEVKRILPDTIEITVQERHVKFMLKLLNSYAYINSQGYILEITDLTKEVPIIEGITTPEEQIIAGNRLNAEDLKKLETALKIMSSCEENEISRYVTGINIEDPNEYTMYLSEKGKTVHLGDASNIGTKMLYVKAILEAEEGNQGDIFVNGDLNNGFQPFFRKKI